MYALDNAARAWGVEIVEMRPHHAVARMTVRDDMLNSHGVCHGAMLFALSDWVLGHQRFAGPLPGGRLAVMIPYHVGQALLLAGLATVA